MRKLECVLLVDDDFASNYLTDIIIKDMNFAENTHIVRDGKAAVDFMRNYCLPKQTSTTITCPDLILLDINMPLMDGWEFLKKIDQLEQRNHFHTNVYLYTSSVYHEDKVKAKSFPIVKKVFVKPLTKEAIQEMLAG